MARGPHTAIIHRDKQRTVQSVAGGVRQQERAQKAKPSPVDGDGVLVAAQTVAASSTKKIPHSLKRAPRGVIIVSPTTAAGTDVYVTAQNSTSVSITNPVASSAKFSLYIF